MLRCTVSKTPKFVKSLLRNLYFLVSPVILEVKSEIKHLRTRNFTSKQKFTHTHAKKNVINGDLSLCKLCTEMGGGE